MQTYIFNIKIEGEYPITANSITEALERIQRITQEHKTLILTNIKKAETHFDREEK